jgi:hypothetical protein
MQDMRWTSAAGISLQSAFDDRLCILAPAVGIKFGEITDEEIARFVKVRD